jgi:hypothetical protein
MAGSSDRTPLRRLFRGGTEEESGVSILMSKSILGVFAHESRLVAELSAA